MSDTPRYRAIAGRELPHHPRLLHLPAPTRLAMAAVAEVLPFRVNEYVIDTLIDWERVPEDPIFQLVFPQPEMLSPEQRAPIEQALTLGASSDALAQLVQQTRAQLNPHPAGQLSHNVPNLESRRLDGIQHKYRETVLFFPRQGQTCHAYCSYCFRWPQFVGDADLRFASDEVEALVAYVRSRPDVTSVLITGGDPMIMKTSLLARYIEPLLEVPHLATIRIGTKALAFWPYRFTHDVDADQLLRLFERVGAAQKSLALMAHSSHPRELETQAAQAAIARIRSTGAVIRTQAPLIRRVNDDPTIWADKWRLEVQLGMVPYYMFVERDTGPRGYFEVPLAKAVQIYQEATRQVSGLARTARGPSMSATPGKVVVDGVAEIGGKRVFVLRFLQARRPDWVGRPFFAEYDPKATWLDQLRPAFGAPEHFYERELGQLLSAGGGFSEPILRRRALQLMGEVA
ncbi:MAG: lysine 2,3-aminomutase [Deltaproteobacteria bacterium]|nr:lysine 2,3-aminomutase [Deltaproteobacteria bacterium]